MNKRIWTSMWIAILLLAFMSPVSAQGPAGIAGVDPAEGTVGSLLTVNGAGFGEKRGEVLIGEEKCQVLAWSDAQIVCEVHKPQLAGEYLVTVLLQGDKKPAEPLTYASFTMRRPQLDREAGAIQDGNVVTIQGAFFGNKKGEVRLGYLDDQIEAESLKVVDWSMNTISFELPEVLPERFVLVVRNDVGAAYELVGFDGMLKYEQPLPGYGNEFGYATASGIYFPRDGKFYVFSVKASCDARTGCEAIRARTITQTATNVTFSGDLGGWPGGVTYASVVPLVVGDKLFVFHTGQNAGIYFLSYDGATWSGWQQIGDLATNKEWEVAPVYNPVTGKLSVYYENSGHLHWTTSSNLGVTWTAGVDVSPYIAVNGAGLSALHYDGFSRDGRAYDTLVALRDGMGYGKVYAVQDGTVLETSLDMIGLQSGRPFLVDLDSQYLAVVYGTGDHVPTIRLMNKATREWRLGTQLLPPMSDSHYSFGYDPNLAISVVPDASGGTVANVFWGYDVDFPYMDHPEHRWMMTPVAIPQPGGPIPTFTAVSSSQEHTCGIKTDGTVQCWGADDRGRLYPPAGVQFKQISSATWHNCGIRTVDNKLQCWGADDDGRLYPPTDSTFTNVAVGDWHGCAVRESDGTVDCWGKADDWRTWDPPGNFTQVSSGDWHNCGILTTGKGYCWGDEDDGRKSPPDTVISQLSSADWHNCAVKPDNHIVCWGNNDEGRMNAPADVHFVQVSSGNWHSCGITTDGTIRCWGCNDEGRVSLTPIGGKFVQIEAGDRHTCAVRDNGIVVCWGKNDKGQSSPPN